MKNLANSIGNFAHKHPIITFFIVNTVCSALTTTIRESVKQLANKSKQETKKKKAKPSSSKKVSKKEKEVKE